MLAEKSGGIVSKVQNDLQPASKPLKSKMTKAERRALQEAQRAAKAATKGLTNIFTIRLTIFFSSGHSSYC